MEKITAVIPTIGRVDTLPALLASLAFQTVPIAELIILDESKTPVSESHTVNQAMDVLSVQGTEVKVLRSRRRSGIGAARYKLASEASNELILMIDDDVVLRPDCLEGMVSAMMESKERVPWVVPVCFLVPAAMELDGYTDQKVSYEDPEVQRWIKKYPWFLPYFRYEEEFVEEVECSGTQAILIRKSVTKKWAEVASLGNLPREDTYMTTISGPGLFTSVSECLHFEHKSQVDRGNWDRTLFYRAHEAVISDPKGFVKLMGGK